MLMPFAVLFGSVVALLGLPWMLAEPAYGSAQRGGRGSRVAILLGVAVAFLLVHGELRSPPAVRAGFILGAGIASAVLLGLGGRRYAIRRALLAERPRSPDEWTDADGVRLWRGRLVAALPVPPTGALPCCLYRRDEIDRWDQGRWRRVAIREHFGDQLELVGKTRRLAVSAPAAALRRDARELSPHAACPDGWRDDPSPDPSALYRARRLGLPNGSVAQVLARAHRDVRAGMTLAQVSAHALAFDERGAARLGRQAWALGLMGLGCALLGLLGAWPG